MKNYQSEKDSFGDDVDRIIGRQRGPRVPQHRPGPDLEPEVFLVFPELVRVGPGGRQVVQQVEGLLEVDVVGRTVLSVSVELEARETSPIYSTLQST